MPDYRRDNPGSQFEAPVSISHIVRTLRTYLPAMALAMGAVIVGFMIVAIAIFALGAAQTVTTLRFRVDFKGADRGEYPNGTKFSSTEIINTPILLNVYNANELSRYAPFNDFTKSIFVLETNAEYETLAREYQARLTDPKLSPVDRDRLQRDYELRLASLSKDQYSLNYLRTGNTRAIPDKIARKALHDILNEWARLVANEQHVLEYRIALVSPAAIAATPGEEPDLIIATQVLRSQVLRVSANIESLRKFPASELMRSKGGMSLLDIDARLDDILRFQLDPLVNRIATEGLLGDRKATIRFLETQLAHDQRTLEAQKQIAEAARMAMVMYMSGSSAPADIVGSGEASNAISSRPDQDGSRESQSVMPQLSESFLDRLIKITASEAGMKYRQQLTDEYRAAMLRIVPLQGAVTYDSDVLEIVRGTAQGNTTTTREVNGQLKATRDETRDLVLQIHQIYETLSRNLNPGTQLLTTLGPPTTRLERRLGMKQLALYGLLVCFIALPIIVVFSLLHNRVREEEAALESVDPDEEDDGPPTTRYRETHP